LGIVLSVHDYFRSLSENKTGSNFQIGSQTGKVIALAINSPRGTADIYGENIKYRNFVINSVRELFEVFNFEEIINPAFEHTEVFSRSIGESTDIVQKEMYTFPDRKGRSLTLRPEGTASVVRAVVEKKMLIPENIPLKLFYIGNMFRYERPQKGRMREFWQIGVEALGSDDPILDAEIIWMLNKIFDRLGFKNLKLLINSIGCSKCRKDFIIKFKEFIQPEIEGLCGDCKQRYKKNPLRIFDCKVPGCKAIVDGSPKINEFLCDSCSDHFDKVKEALADLSLDYRVSDDLVRGFDYYTGTIFEMISTDLESAQNALGGGGRYDRLLKEFNGPDKPAIGFAIGLDRTIMLMKDLGIKYITGESKAKVYIISIADSGSSYIISILKDLRDGGIICDMDYAGSSIGAGIKRAGKKGFNIAVIIGDDEINNNTITIKDLKDYKQYNINKDKLLEKISEIIGAVKND